MTRSVSRLAILVAGVLVATAASANSGAETFTYQGIEVASLSWSTAGSVTSFALDFESAPNNLGFVKALDFNGPNGAFSDTDSTTSSTGTYGPFQVGGFAYNWKVGFPGKNAGASQLTVGETATWTIASAGTFVPDMPIISFGNFTTEGQGVSICGVSVVPEPASGAMLLAGLAGLGLLARRRGTHTQL